MELKLDAAETALLADILRRHLSLIREEVGKTENFQMRQELKADEAILKGILERLAQAPTVAAPGSS